MPTCKKMIIPVICLSLLFAGSIPAYAEPANISGLLESDILQDYDPSTGTVSFSMDMLSEDTQNALMESYTTQLDMDSFQPDSQEYRNQLLENFATAAMSDKGMNFSEAFNASIEGFQIDTSKLYDNVNATADFGLVNLKYDDAAKKLQEFSSEYSSKIDFSGTGMSVFNSTYGDMLSSVDMSGYRIPDSFNPSATAKSMGDSFKTAYGSNELVNSIASSIDISSIFNAASQPMSMPSLESYGSLQGMVADASAALKANSVSQYNEDVAFVKSTSNPEELYNNLQNIISNVDELKVRQDEARKDMEDKRNSRGSGYSFDDVLDKIMQVSPMEPVDGGPIISGVNDNNGAGTLMVTPFDGVHIDGVSWIDGDELIYTGYDGVKGSVQTAQGLYTHTDQEVMALAQVRVPITEIAPYIVDGSFSFEDPSSEEAQYWTAISQNIVDKNLTIDARGNLVEKQN